ncbi:MAG TPA: translation initiation factor [Spirochaetia bacterium]|nr:translation initiation factor [Spirochaetia bacterium]HBI38435.1 translation initiation factor [Spirochaetia bacterium]
MQAIIYFINREGKMSKKNDNNYVFSYNSEGEMPKHFFDKSGNFIGNVNKSNDGFIRVQLDKKSRGGKTVTLVWGFNETADINTICSELKKKSASGGAVKESKIEIQGDKLAVIEKYLLDNNYKVKKVGG